MRLKNLKRHPKSKPLKFRFKQEKFRSFYKTSWPKLTKVYPTYRLEDKVAVIG